MNQYPLWKYLLILAVILVGTLYALPNIYGQDPAVQISSTRGVAVGVPVREKAAAVLKKAAIGYKSMAFHDGRLLIRFNDTDDQLRARGLLAAGVGSDYVVALNLAASTPKWLRDINAKPMYLGLDLRGGVHFLMSVDTHAAVQQSLESDVSDLRTLLRRKKIRYTDVSRDKDTIRLQFRDASDRDRARDLIKAEEGDLTVTEVPSQTKFELHASLSPQQQRTIRNFAVQQNITTLRNRINELGVAEPVIQQQGKDRIVVELPGVQDTARAKEILGATATLAFHMVDENHSAEDALATGHIPAGSRIYRERDNGRPVLLYKRVIITGNQITDASSGLDQESGQAAVFVTLDGKGARIMENTTRKNIGRRMAVVFIDNKVTTNMVDGKPVRVQKKVENVINVAVIRGQFGKRFQITGLDNPVEARNLALLLRAGALAAPIEIIEETTIGPSLGKENIKQGFEAVAMGFLAVLVFMSAYYRVFGLVANLALLLNLVVVVALLSILQATLTMPGIAGIVLTLGMAVDSNVLIYERIREELRNGNTPQASIHAGFDKAFGTIIDSNVTTLIAAIVLFSFGTGPVKGFAVTLSIGILTSMFTAIMGSRAVINLMYGGRKVKRLLI
ncbi:MAG: protein translocase subunit SecD [Chromatiales bacterium 21-64-14]|nr:MAG: protein translocase subunit SecD [Chromatiales bacterium 21-64-14]HQU15042.1 protein translocase subunit SecD [Gammaproteobacteria bacterium]